MVRQSRMRVEAIVAEPLAIHRVGTKAGGSEIAELLDLVGLNASAATRLPHEFSGGQRQRSALPRARVGQAGCLR